MKNSDLFNESELEGATEVYYGSAKKGGKMDF